MAKLPVQTVQSKTSILGFHSFWPFRRTAEHSRLARKEKKKEMKTEKDDDQYDPLEDEEEDEE